MATHSSVLAWRIPGTGDPGGLPSLRWHRVGHDWSYLAAAWKGKLRLSVLKLYLAGMILVGQDRIIATQDISSFWHSLLTDLKVDLGESEIGSHSVVSDSLWPVDCSPLSSFIHGILQARILEWVTISFSRGSSWPRDQTQVSHITGRHFNLCTARETLKYSLSENLL